jgi:pimeloyl-ACP methyl ester carboxylesterase
MPFMPFAIIGIWLRGLLAIALIGLGVYLVREWYEETQVRPRPVVVVAGDDRRDTDAPRDGEARRVVAWRPGLNRPTAYLAGGLALLAWSALGGLVVMPLLKRLGGNAPGSKPTPHGADDPEAQRHQLRADEVASDPQGREDDDPTTDRAGTVQRLKRPDGSELQVEVYGPPDAPPIVLTHGWGANSTAWYYVKKHLAGRFRLIVWDLPGLGLSRRPETNDYSLENLARDLDAVVALAGDRPAVLVGHSIGGMITLTYCKLFREALGRRVSGLVLAHSTYTNPVRTTKKADLYTALQKPVIEPLLHLTIWLSPLVWVMNWLSYLNGSAHRSTAQQSFAGTETWGQLNFVARLMPHPSPAVLARGMFGMLAYDATAVLPTIPVPVLIVTGDRDPVTLPEASEHMRGAIPGARLVSLAPARHFGLMEHHGRFGEAIGAFTAECAQARPGVAAEPRTS